MSDLTQEEIDAALVTCPHWRREGKQVTAKFEFASFPQAVQFVIAVASIAEDLDHHPDIDIRYNQVCLAVFSHDVGRITTRDLQLAARVEKLLEH